MSWDAVGKSAKYMGITHHRHERRLDPDPVPPKVPGAAKPKKVRKRFSFTYQKRYTFRMLGEKSPKWKTIEHWSWYETERQRNDAMRTAGRMFSHCEIRNVKPVERD